MTTFISSVACTRKYTATMPIAVYLASTNATGTTITHVNTESNRNVTSVLPPERSVKYDECVNAQNGIIIADTAMKLVASDLISSVVLYIWGKSPPTRSMTAAITEQQNTLNTIILLSASFAFSSSPAPRYCPTTMLMHAPSCINTILKRFVIVVAMFKPAITESPRTE